MTTISLVLLTAVTCNEHTICDSTTLEELQKKLKESELQKQLLERNHEMDVMKLAIVHLQHGDVDSACSEFQTLKNKDNLVEEMVQSAYANKKVQLQHLARFTCDIKTFSTGYNAINALHQELAKNNQLEKKEVITMYFRLKFMVNYLRFSSQTSSLQSNILRLKTKIAENYLHIMEIASSGDSTFKKTLINNYKNYITQEEYNDVIALHERYRMEYFYTDFINSLTQSEMQNDNFNKIVNAITTLPSLYDTCYAVDTVYRRLKNLDMLRQFEHFQTLQIVRNAQAKFDYKNADESSKSKCESVEKDAPFLFKQFLYRDTFDCKLTNRYFEESLFCTSWEHTKYDYSRIFTWTPKEDDEEQYWNLKVDENLHGVHLLNNYHKNMTLRFIDGNVRGSDQELDRQHDFFRIHTVDDIHILLEPTSGKLFKPILLVAFMVVTYIYIYIHQYYFHAESFCPSLVYFF